MLKQKLRVYKILKYLLHSLHILCSECTGTAVTVMFRKITSILILLYITFICTVYAAPSSLLRLTQNFDYQIPRTDLSIQGYYDNDESSQIPAIPLILALRSLYSAVTSHIDAAGDGPILPPASPMIRTVLASPYELVVKSFVGKLTYGDVRYVVDEDIGIGFPLRTSIRFHAFQAQIIKDGERLGWISTDLRSQSRRDLGFAPNSSVDTSARGCWRLAS